MSEVTPQPELRSRSELRTRSRAATSPGIARHGRLRKASPVGTVFKLIAAALAVVLVSGASVAALAVNSVASVSTFVDIPSTVPKGQPIPEIGAIEGGFNILIAGSDTRAGQGGIGGTVEDDSGNLNDVTMLMHVSQDQTNAVVLTIPRDMVVRIPDCTDADGYTKPYSSEPINVAISYGGLGCIAQTVTELTGLPIQYAGLITFQGVIAMSDAVGGVDVCVDGPMIDPSSGINLPEAGKYTLQGGEALAFLRSRYAVGDGSDLTRISSQQVYLSSLVRKLKSSKTLGDVKKVYALATAAVGNMKLSTSLGSITTMLTIAQALKNIPLDNVTFVQYPGTTGGDGIYSGKVQPNTYLGGQMMDYIKSDQRFVLDGVGDDRGSTIDPNAPVEPSVPATPTPGAPDVPVLAGVSGQTAAQQTCTITNTY